MKKQFITLLSSTLLLAACSHQPEWKITGSVPAGTSMVVLEEPGVAGQWTPTDSVAPDSNGKFSMTRPAANGTIYRLAAGGDTVYLPADSTETITLTIDSVKGISLGGSPEAALFMKVDSVLAAAPAGETANALLRTLDGNLSSLAAYYAVSRVDDWRLLRTVANRHLEEKPTEPRTAVLAARFENARRKRADNKGAASPVVLEAPVTRYFDIELMNRQGKMQKLSSLIETAPVALLAFVDVDAESSPAVHLALGEANNAGVQIYEVGFSQNQHIWANAIESLPWANVYQSETAGRTHLQQYRVDGLPTFFLFRNGELVERITELTKLKQLK